MDEKLEDENLGEENQDNGNSLQEKENSSAQSSSNKSSQIQKQIQKRLSNAAKKNAVKSSFIRALFPILTWFLVFIIALIIIIGIVMFFITMPGMVMEQIKALFEKLGNYVAGFFGADTTEQISEENVYETLDYLEQMGYDLKGYGFLTEYIGDDDDGLERDSENDKISEAKSDYIFSYIASDNYVYTLKKDNLATKEESDNWFEQLGASIATGWYKFRNFFYGPIFDKLGITNAAGEKWGKGLIGLYYESGNQIGKQGTFVNTGTIWNRDNFKINIEKKKLSIQKNDFLNNNNPIEFSLDGWTGRYGMPVDFLLSVHIATMMPDLAMDMIASFPTEIKVFLHDVSGEATTAYKVGTRYITYEELETALSGVAGRNILSSAKAWFDNWNISSEEANAAFEAGMPHSSACSCTTTYKFNGEPVKIGDDGRYVYEDESKDSSDIKADEVVATQEVSGECKNYIKSVLKLLRKDNDYNFKAYMPYIANVSNHWYRDVYFVMEDTNLKFVDYDYEYEAFVKERWSLYETYSSDENPDREGEFKLYKIKEDGSFGELFDGTQEEAQKQNIPVSKKSKTIDSSDSGTMGDLGWNKAEDIWIAYEENDDSSTAKYEPAYPDITEEEDQYNLKKDIYVKVDTTGNVVQTGEGQRTETNESIKKIFLVNKYFRYDGSADTAEKITELRKKVASNHNMDTYYSALTEDDLEESITVETDGEAKTFSVKDFSGSVSLNQDSLNAFSMLENTHTLDADYIYRDFKELIVELGYFKKEELTDETPRLLQWLIPDIGSYGYPNREMDKNEHEYGTMAHSKFDYEANHKNTLKAMYEKAAEEKQNGERDENIESGAVFEMEGTPEIAEIATTSSKMSTTTVGNIQLSNDTTTKINQIVGAMGSDFERIAESGDGYEYKVKTGSVEYTHYYQFMGSYAEKTFNWSGATKTLHAAACGPTSCINLLTGYGQDVNPTDNIVGINFNATIDGIKEFMEQYEVTGESFSGLSDDEYTTRIEEAFSQGRPIIVLMQQSKTGDSFWTSQGHFVPMIGQDKNGNIITLDSGSSNPERHTYTGGVEGLMSSIVGLWVADEPPNGTLKSEGDVYEGYTGNEAVVSPVTGILLDYGVYTDKEDSTGDAPRVNTDLLYGTSLLKTTDEEEKEAEGDGNQSEGTESELRKVSDKVGYAKILVLDKENYKKIESQMLGKTQWSQSFLTSNGNYKNIDGIKEEMINDEDNPWSDIDRTLYGYKEFAEIYEQFGIAGNVIFIDGFKCEIPDTEFKLDDINTSSPDGEDMYLNKFKEIFKISNFDSAGNIAEDAEILESLYEQEEEYKLASEKATNKLNAESLLKNDAVSSLYIDTDDLIVLKEGTIIGRTMTDRELVVDLRRESYEDVRPNGVKVDGGTSSNEGTSDTETNGEKKEDKVIGNYIRTIMYDNKNTVVENIEDYMKLDEGGDIKTQTDNFSIIGTVLSIEEWVEMAYKYATEHGCSSVFQNKDNLREYYNIHMEKGVNPEYTFVRGIQESGLSDSLSGGGINFWGYATPNGSALGQFSSWQQVIGLYCDTIVEYQDPSTWQYAEIMKRNDERAACTENGGIDPLGYGDPTTIGGQQCLYSWLGDNHLADSAGAGGMYYLHPWHHGLTGYEGENKIIFESEAEFEALCGTPHGTTGGTTSATKTTVWEQGMYTAYQSRIIVKTAKEIFGERAGTYAAR